MPPVGAKLPLSASEDRATAKQPSTDDANNDANDDDVVTVGAVLPSPLNARLDLAVAVSRVTDASGLEAAVGHALLQTADWRPLRLVTYNDHTALLLGPAASTYATVEGLNVLCSCPVCAAPRGATRGAPPLFCGREADTCIHGLLQWVAHVEPAGWRAQRAAACEAAGAPPPPPPGSDGGPLVDAAAAEELRRAIVGRTQVYEELLPDDAAGPEAAAKTTSSRASSGGGGRSSSRGAASAWSRPVGLEEWLAAGARDAGGAALVGRRVFLYVPRALRGQQGAAVRAPGSGGDADADAGAALAATACPRCGGQHGSWVRAAVTGCGGAGAGVLGAALHALRFVVAGRLHTGCALLGVSRWRLELDGPPAACACGLEEPGAPGPRAGPETQPDLQVCKDQDGEQLGAEPQQQSQQQRQDEGWAGEETQPPFQPADVEMVYLAEATPSPATAATGAEDQHMEDQCQLAAEDSKQQTDDLGTQDLQADSQQIEDEETDEQAASAAEPPELPPAAPAAEPVAALQLPKLPALPQLTGQSTAAERAAVFQAATAGLRSVLQAVRGRHTSLGPLFNALRGASLEQLVRQYNTLAEACGSGDAAAAARWVDTSAPDGGGV
jgi:hypothetical protein